MHFSRILPLAVLACSHFVVAQGVNDTNAVAQTGAAAAATDLPTSVTLDASSNTTSTEETDMPSAASGAPVSGSTLADPDASNSTSTVPVAPDTSVPSSAPSPDSSSMPQPHNGTHHDHGGRPDHPHHHNRPDGTKFDGERHNRTGERIHFVRPIDEDKVVQRREDRHGEQHNETELVEHEKFNATGKAHPHHQHDHEHHKNGTDSHPMEDGEKHRHGNKKNGTAEEQVPNLPVQPVDGTTVVARGEFNATDNKHPHHDHDYKDEHHKNGTDSHPMKDGKKHEHHKHNGTATEEKTPDASKLPVQPVDDTTVAARDENGHPKHDHEHHNGTDSHHMKDGEKHGHHKHNGTAEEKTPDASKIPVQPVDDTTVVARGDFKDVINADHYNETELPEHHKFNQTGKAHPQHDHGVKPITADEWKEFPQHQRN